MGQPNKIVIFRVYLGLKILKKSMIIKNRNLKSLGENNNVVLVSIENLKNLKKVYPNYFLDAREFVTTIEKYINTEI